MLGCLLHGAGGGEDDPASHPENPPDLGGAPYRWCGFCGAKQYLPKKIPALRFPEVDRCPRCRERDWRDEIDEITAPDYREDREGR
jgi:hypothetical protein